MSIQLYGTSNPAHAAELAVLNRPWNQMLAQSGEAPDGSTFSGFATALALSAEIAARITGSAGKLDTYASVLGEVGVTSRQYPRGDPRRYGAIGDGASHPLSATYGTLGAAQAVYPFVTALTQETDWAALQAMSNAALGWNGAEHAAANAHLNVPMLLPAGSYQLGNDTWLIRNAVSARIEGAGRLATKLYGNSVVFATDGFWYSQITGVAFIGQSAASAAVVDLDGNVPGHPYATRGVQANTFKDLSVGGSGVVAKGFAVTRQGNPPGPGAQGSEMLFLNCHFESCTFANYWSSGFNALNNTFIGGNFQGHTKYGAYFAQGSCHFFSVGFQSTTGYAQILNDGYDINFSDGGVDDHITIIGCRTESMRFVRGGFAQPPLIMGCNQSIGGSGFVAWVAGAVVPLNAALFATSATSGRKMYVATTAGVSGGVEPVWPDSGTVANGTVVWTETDYDVVLCPGSGEVRSSSFDAAGFVSMGSQWHERVKEINASYTAKPEDSMIVCYNTTDITITIPQFTGTATVRQVGQTITVKKTLPNAGKVTVTYGGGSLDGAPTHFVLPGGSTGHVAVRPAGGGAISAGGWIVSKSIERTGTALVAGDFALSAGFGATASVAVATKSNDTRGAITVTSAGAGLAANPTVTLTFKDGAFPAAPFAVVARAGGSQRTVPVEVTSVSTTQLVITFLGTPVAAETYTIAWQVSA